MEVRLMEIPSFRILSVRTSVEKGRDLVDACMCNHLLALCEGLLIERSGVPELSGLALLHGNWFDRTPADIVVEEGLILKQDIMSYDELLKIADSSKSASPVGLSVSHTPGGLYAVVRMKGPYSKLGDSYNELLNNWVKNNPFEYSGGPMLELYINSLESTNEDELLTDVCCPVSPHGGGGRWNEINMFRTTVPQT